MEFVNKMRAKKSLSRRKYYIFLDKRRGTPEQIKARFGVAVLEALTRTQCSRAIDEFSGKVVA